MIGSVVRLKIVNEPSTDRPQKVLPFMTVRLKYNLIWSSVTYFVYTLKQTKLFHGNANKEYFIKTSSQTTSMRRLPEITSVDANF